MDFSVPQDLTDYLADLDAFSEAEIKPLELADDNLRFFDHRREQARTDWDNDGLPRPEWEALLKEARQRADAGGGEMEPGDWFTFLARAALRAAGVVGQEGEPNRA